MHFVLYTALKPRLTECYKAKMASYAARPSPKTMVESPGHRLDGLGARPVLIAKANRRLPCVEGVGHIISCCRGVHCFGIWTFGK